jgi:hypothetical protein
MSKRKQTKPENANLEGQTEMFPAAEKPQGPPAIVSPPYVPKRYVIMGVERSADKPTPICEVDSHPERIVAAAKKNRRFLRVWFDDRRFTAAE